MTKSMEYNSADKYGEKIRTWKKWIIDDDDADDGDNNNDHIKEDRMTLDHIEIPQIEWNENDEVINKMSGSSIIECSIISRLQL